MRGFFKAVWILLLCDPVTATVCTCKAVVLWVTERVVMFNEARSRRFDMIVWLSELPYKEYLLTDYWKNRREEWIAKAAGACQLCNASDNVLNVHHRRYDRRGHEMDSDVIVLCRNCHAKHHDKLHPSSIGAVMAGQ